MTPAQHSVHRELCNAHAAVSIVDLDEGLVALRALNADGEVITVRVLDVDGIGLAPDDAIRALGATRQRAELLAEQATAGLVELLALREGNLTAAARDAGLSRQTLYNRLADVRLAPRAA